jgi:hypothetical protein
VIRRGDEFRIGPIRVPVLSNNDGRCSVVAIYGTSGSLGMVGTIDEEVLEKLAEEDGVTVRYASQKPKQ